MGSQDRILVAGARQHNLKNISVTIPRNALTVVTGLSGSGKSSLAFDTIYAEGERKYVESLSAYARQFLEQMPKPDVDHIDGLSPTVAIEQRVASANPRSTVATTTEIYDYLRILFARAGTPGCWECERTITRQTTAEMADLILRSPKGTRAVILAPIDATNETPRAMLLDRIARQGFVRIRLNGTVMPIESAPSPIPKNANLDVVVDRLVLRDQIGARLADSIELASRVGTGRVIAILESPDKETSELAFSHHFACPNHPQVRLQELSPRVFSFNSPYGACPDCNGLGTVLEFDPELIVPDTDRSLAGGAIAAWRKHGRRQASDDNNLITTFCEQFEVSPEIPFRNIPKPLVQILLHGTTRAESKQYGRTFKGVIPVLRARWENTESEGVKQRLHQCLSEAPCDTCNGQRLRRESLAVTLQGTNIADVCNMNVAQAHQFFDALSFTGEDAVIAEQPVREIRNRLRFLCDVGLEYLALSRSSATLSGGEAQRIRLATQIGSGLIGMCYVLDEPTIGLHQRDSRRLVDTLKTLAHAGNTVLVVEHDEEVIASAEHVIDIGPGAGANGGSLLFEGTFDALLNCRESITAQYLTGRQSIPVPSNRRPTVRTNFLEIRGATANNLQNLDVRFPLGCFVCVTGVSGSGKSTLVTQILLRTLQRRINGTGPRPGAHERIVGASRVDKVIEIDQSPIGRSPRSNPATYVGVFDLIRQLYAQTREAKLRGYGASRFSFNVKGGRCEDCQGQGTKRIEMHFLPDVFVQCGTCNGQRYNRETLDVRYRGKNIADALEMRAEEAALFFQNFPRIKQLLRALEDVGLGYVKLGQSSITLSGGEAQRVKLAAELGKSASGHTVYILDEPTTGLHFADIHKLLNVLNRLATMGNTIIVIEHNLDVIKQADWVIDLGPEGGEGGGRIVAQGTPEEIAECAESYTGQCLKPRLNDPQKPSKNAPKRGRKRTARTA